MNVAPALQTSSDIRENNDSYWVSHFPNHDRADHGGQKTNQTTKNHHQNNNNAWVRTCVCV